MRSLVGLSSVGMLLLLGACAPSSDDDVPEVWIPELNLLNDGGASGVWVIEEPALPPSTEPSVAADAGNEPANAGAAAPSVNLAFTADADVQELTWDDLMPPGEWDLYDAEVLAFFEQLDLANIGEGTAEDAAIQFGTFNVVEELDGTRVRLPGFVVPFDFSSDRRVQEFLLVPYFGACIHLPPPPPNQIVYVTAETPAFIEDLWYPVWVQGVLRTEQNINGLGDTAYTLYLESVTPYQL